MAKKRTAEIAGAGLGGFYLTDGEERAETPEQKIIAMLRG